ncbi:MAG: IclR family transcriptional regulator [Mycobacterium sp.]|nr:IclR family transcriptional regulator [Mycobacterium sp.]
MAVARLSTVEKALRVLSAVADSQPISGSALARELEMDKNAVQRILITLGHLGWLQQDRRAGGWRLGPQSLVVGGRYAGALRERAHPLLHDLAAETGETVTLWSVEGDAFTVVDAVESSQTIRGTIPIGYSASITEGGDFLAFCEREVRARLVSSSGRPAMSDEQVESVRRQGYYVVDTSYTSTIAVGAPVWESRPSPAAAVLLVAPAERLRDKVAETGMRMREVATQLSTAYTRSGRVA